LGQISGPDEGNLNLPLFGDGSDFFVVRGSYDTA
jgi:hypothetical protein